MIRTALRLAGLAVAFWAFATPATAAPVDIYVDTAPNVYGSPDYPAWQADAWDGAANGTFTNMANSANPANAGTTYFDIQDIVVYSYGDLGQRLHFVYYIPGETIASLTGRFQIAMYYEWDGVTYDFYNDYYGSTWLTPTRWEEVAGGVIGTAGFAWWGAYGVNTDEALAAEYAEWSMYQGDIQLVAMLDNETYDLTAMFRAVPEPASLALFGLGLAGIAFVRRRRRAA